jgi:inner membrane protein
VLPELGQGVHAKLAATDYKQVAMLEFNISMSLGGAESFDITPLADQNKFSLTSPWPHPQFLGQFLPRTREISETGFSASWEINALATQAQAQLMGGKMGETTDQKPQRATVIDTVQVGLVDPVNIYLQAERAIKYGILFIGLTFVAFFFFETLKSLPVHPIQYGLVGLALVLFFLLLVALSEHFAFWKSYAAASIACISVIAVYLMAVLKSRARGLGFGAGLTVLYAALYGLLVSEQNALVLGAIMLFLIVATVMLATRHVNWHALTAPVVAAVRPAAPQAVE